jgi:hypothetical protein
MLSPALVVAFKLLFLLIYYRRFACDVNALTLLRNVNIYKHL